MHSSSQKRLICMVFVVISHTST